MRQMLWSNIVLAGGSTLYSGFGARLLKELQLVAPQDTKIKIFAPPERALTCWLGGSILASLTTFSSMWVTKQQWEEEGPNAFLSLTL
mmetsp:Transcript_16492/g.18333  ORF Transcript_16492/g.18333 Transcript_16492/m.18333 type:complete len:88 (+) Transcript_16492:1-264(+)